MNDRKLTPKQDAFVVAYLETGNASEAYRRAYDVRNMKPATINNSAWELMKHPVISARLAQHRDATFERSTIDRAGVLALITEIATADASKLAEVQVRCCRNCWGAGHMHQWKNAAEFGFALAAAMDREAEELRAWEKEIALGSKRPQPEPHKLPDDSGGYGFDVYASPNPECPKCLGEGHVMPVVKDTRKLCGAAKRLYAGFKQTRDGIEIKTRSQDAALALLAKEFGIAKDAPPVQVAVGVNAQGAESVTVIATDPLEAARQYQDFMKG